MQVIIPQRAGTLIEERQAHEQRQAANDGDEEIGFCGADRLTGLLVDDPHKGSQ